jgi:hypothetical protein
MMHSLSVQLSIPVSEQLGTAGIFLVARKFRQLINATFPVHFLLGIASSGMRKFHPMSL